METKEVIKTKAFKLAESDVKQVNEILSKLDGTSESEKLINALQTALATEAKSGALESLPKNLSKVFQGDFEKVGMAISTIQSVFDTLLFSVTEEVSKREKLIEEKYHKQIESLTKDKELLNNQINKLNDTINEHSSVKINSEKVISQLTEENKLLTNKEESYLTQIEELKEQSKSDKEEHRKEIEELKKQLSNTRSELSYQVEDSRKYKDKIELLEQKNDELSNSYNSINKVNIELTNKINILEFKYNASNEQIQAAREELDGERKSKSELQKELLELMKSMNNKAAVTSTEQKQQSKSKNKFKIKDQKGKVIFTGTKQEMLKHVNSLNRVKVNNSTSIDEIEEILHPFTIETV